MTPTPKNPRNAGRKPKGRRDAGLRLSPETLAALDADAAAHGRSRSDSAEIILDAALASAGNPLTTAKTDAN